MNRKLVILLIAFTISFMAMVGLSLFSVERFNTFKSYSRAVFMSNMAIKELYDTEMYLKDMDRTERGYILTNDSTYAEKVISCIDSLGPRILRLEQIMVKNPRQITNLNTLKYYIEQRVHNARDNMFYVDSSGSNDASPFYYEGRKYMLAASRMLRDMQKTENLLLADKYRKQQFYQQLATSTLKSLLFIFCAVALVLFILIIKVFRSSLLYQEELQAKVADLKHSHAQLQDIAYTISHDMQEPLRKIQVFSDMLRSTDSSGGDKDALTRINSSANRMQLLIADLVSLTNLTNTDEPKVAIDVNRVIEYVLLELQDLIMLKNADISVVKMPEIKGYKSQLHLLFKSILDNALKFEKTGVRPRISINYEKLAGQDIVDVKGIVKNKSYHCISITDNGIGFDKQYIANMFRIFRRLHALDSAYEGKGIGLAICQRIVTNHNGFITAEGEPQVGATFKVFFPI